MNALYLFMEQLLVLLHRQVDSILKLVKSRQKNFPHNLKQILYVKNRDESYKRLVNSLRNSVKEALHHNLY